MKKGSTFAELFRKRYGKAENIERIATIEVVQEMSLTDSWSVKVKVFSVNFPPKEKLKTIRKIRRLRDNRVRWASRLQG